MDMRSDVRMDACTDAEYIVMAQYIVMALHRRVKQTGEGGGGACRRARRLTQDRALGLAGIECVKLVFSKKIFLKDPHETRARPSASVRGTSTAEKI